MITIHRIANSKIAEDWVLVESLGFFQQLGILPGTAELIACRFPLSPGTNHPVAS
jgi:hypothetical protein